MQCSMHNQCSGLFIYIMDYLHVLCIILIALSCVLCMTLMMFIYVYYGLFACTNLIDVISLFSQFFRSMTTDFRGGGGTGRISVFLVFTIFPSSLVHFSQIFSIFTDFCRILKNRPNR
jgi:hypothetical protein